ncbi:Striatin-domain-containing protein [Nadsonia fulvescens var. elongata DSM 6958]|uniref:Striatin-domain-containing protein n=1 Tax=Nadsonia fulvescens var. elongata DSM 6958 TaxID=857566 RepID=A0A1E3PLG6_9ASCO|nr:Striatin-domain-containing protein [Nadsonia fulvescens var. elongata DSM 6958]
MSSQNLLSTPGWNDCAPTTFSAPIVSQRCSPAPSRSASLTSLAASNIPPPPKMGSTNISKPPPPSSPLISSRTTPSSTAPGSIESSTVLSSLPSPSLSPSPKATSSTSISAAIIIDQQATLESVTTLLQHSLALPTRLPPHELTHYRNKLDKLLPGLAAEGSAGIHHHLDLVFHALELAQTGASNHNDSEIQHAKELVVRYMMMHTGCKLINFVYRSFSRLSVLGDRSHQTYILLSPQTLRYQTKINLFILLSSIVIGKERTMSNITSLRTGNAGANGHSPGMSNSAGDNTNGINNVRTNGPVGADYTLPGIMKYLQSEWQRNERDRIQWELERAEMKTRIARLEGENRAFHLLVTDHVKQIKILESSLHTQRLTVFMRVRHLETRKIPIDTSSAHQEDAADSTNESTILDVHAISDRLLSSEIEQARRALSNLNPTESDHNPNSLSSPPTLDLKPILESRQYLQQCLEEVSYLLQSGVSDDEGELAEEVSEESSNGERNST